MGKAKTSRAHDMVWQHILSCRQMKDLKFNFNQTFKKFTVDFICKEAKLVIQVDTVEPKLEKLLAKESYRLLVLDGDAVLSDIDGVKKEVEEWVESK